MVPATSCRLGFRRLQGWEHGAGRTLGRANDPGRLIYTASYKTAWRPFSAEKNQFGKGDIACWRLRYFSFDLLELDFVSLLLLESDDFFFDFS